MEPNLSGNQNEKLNQRAVRDADQSVKPRHSAATEGQAQDPVYNARETAKSKVGESYEGFSNAKTPGMPELEKSDGFGSQYQMPGPDMSEKYMNKSEEPRKQLTAGHDATQMEGFVDLQTSVIMIQELVQKIRANLESTEQEELETLLRQGAQLLSANWKQISSSATEQVSTLKSGAKENPYRTLITALKLGMALGQVISSTRRAEPLAEPLNPEADATRHVVH